MKRSLAASTVFLLAFAATLPAAELTLTDGRTFHDATIVSQTPRKVVIKHIDGLSGIEKTLLPAELSARYPLDEAAALEAERQSAAARARADAYHKAEAERAALIRLEREQAALQNAQLAALEAAERRAESAEAELVRRPTVVVYRDTGYFSPFYRHTVTNKPVCDDTPLWNEKPRDNRFVRDNRTPHRDHTTDSDRRSPRQNWTSTPATHRTHNPPAVPRISQTPPTEEEKKPARPTAAVARR
jgi:hypothetical protein